MCAVPNMAVFCSSFTSWFPGMLLTYFLNDFETVPVVPIIACITFAFTFHMLCISIVRSSYFRILSASFLITFLFPEIATSINIHVSFSLSRIIMSGLLLGIVLSVCTCWFHNMVTLTPLLLLLLLLLCQGRDSIVGIASSYELDGLGIDFRWEWDFPHPSRPALEPTLPPVQCVLSETVMFERTASRCPTLLVIPWHSPYNWSKNTGKNSQGGRKVPVVHDFLCRYAHLLTGSLDKSVDPGLSWNALGNLGQPSVSLYISRVAELGVSRHKLTLTQISRLDFWFGQ